MSSPPSSAELAEASSPGINMHSLKSASYLLNKKKASEYQSKKCQKVTARTVNLRKTWERIMKEMNEDGE